MARSQDPNSAGSQFFVCHGEAGFLDNQYTAFGRLTEGFEALAEPDASVALAQAMARAGADGWVLVTGSLYLVGALRPSLSPPGPPPCSPSAPTSS